MPMYNPFMGSIAMTAFSWAPVDWAKCDGQSMQISQHGALFALLATKFGGNGRTSFNLPDLRGRVPIGTGPYSEPSTGFLFNFGHGWKGGVEDITITTATMPSHTHSVSCTDDNGTVPVPTNNIFGAAVDVSGTPSSVYAAASGSIVEMNPASSPYAAGANQSHNNIQPSTVVNFVIALDGLFPPRN